MTKGRDMDRARAASHARDLARKPYPDEIPTTRTWGGWRTPICPECLEKMLVARREMLAAGLTTGELPTTHTYSGTWRLRMDYLPAEEVYECDRCLCRVTPQEGQDRNLHWVPAELRDPNYRRKRRKIRDF